MHFATFHLTDEAIDAPVQALGAALRAHGVSPHDFRIPRFAEPLRFTKER
jgi:hypothetical protein